MEKLPNVVLSNIFIRLLAKQLAQMRSVSKSWNSLLSEKSLIKSHLHHSIHDKDEVFLLFTDPCAFYSEPFCAHPSRYPNVVELSNFIKPPVNNIFWQGECVIGSVNGLICFTNIPYNNVDCLLYIWNPSLSPFLTLPPHFLPSPATGDDPISVNFRFGFNPKADDYKVVKIASLLRPSSFHSKFKFHWLPVEVYSMRKGSWKLITQTFPSHITDIISPQDDVCLDGLLHWIGFIGEEKKELQKIVAFDLGAETFREIHLPDSILHHNLSNRINVLNGKLCVMSYVKDGNCEVWVMDEPWIKHHAFSQFRNIVPIGFTFRNQLLFKDEKIYFDDDYYYCCYGLFDPVAAETKVFKLREDISKIVGYVDSLVWVAPAEIELS